MTVRTLVKSIQDIMRQDTGVDGDAQRISQLCWMFFLKIIDDQDQELELLRDDYKSPIPAGLQWRAWAADPEGITGQELLTFINGDLFPALKELVPATPRARTVRDVFEDAYNYMKSGQLMRQVVNRINGIDFNNLSERQHFGDIYEQILNDLQSAGNAGEYYTPRAVTAFMSEMIDPKPGETLFDPACGTGGFLTCSVRHMRERYVKRPDDEAIMQASLRAVEKKQLPHMLAVTNMLLHGIEDPSFLRHDNTLARPYISWGKDERVDIILTNPPFGGREEDGIETNFPQHFRTRETADLFLALIVRLLKTNGRAAVVLPDGSLFGEGVKTRLKEHLLEECNLHTIVRLPNSVFRPYASIGTNLLFFEKGAPTRDIWFWEHRVPEGQKAYSMTRPIQLEHLADCASWWGGPRREGRVEGEHAWKVSVEEVKARGYNLDIKNPHSVAEDHGDPELLLENLDTAESEVLAIGENLKAILSGGAGAKNAEKFLALYDRVAKAPGAVPRLRRFVLELAVRGKLVAQDPADEPAPELLKRIAAEKPKLVLAGKFKTFEGSLDRDPRSFPFQIPANWSWCYLDDIAAVGRGGSPRPIQAYLTDDPEGIPWIKIGDSTRGSIYIERTQERIRREGLVKSRLVIPGDLLLSNSMSFGFPYITNVEGCIHDGWLVIRTPEKLIDKLYLQKVFLSDHAKAAFSEAASGAVVQNLNADKARQLAVPLPPLDEQRRIVANVDALMALLGRLETALTDTDSIRSRLLHSILHAAFTPATLQELESVE